MNGNRINHDIVEVVVEFLIDISTLERMAEEIRNSFKTSSNEIDSKD